MVCRLRQAQVFGCMCMLPKLLVVVGQGAEGLVWETSVRTEWCGRASGTDSVEPRQHRQMRKHRKLEADSQLGIAGSLACSLAKSFRSRDSNSHAQHCSSSNTLRTNKTFPFIQAMEIALQVIALQSPLRRLSTLHLLKLVFSSLPLLTLHGLLLLSSALSTFKYEVEHGGLARAMH